MAFHDCVEKPGENVTAMAQQKFDGGMTGHSTTLTPWKLDAVRRRNSTAPEFTQTV